MGRLTQCEATDLLVESLQSDNRKLKAEAARLGAEVVQLKHRLAERVDRHDRDGKALLRISAECDELRARAAERERLLAEGVAIVEGLWAKVTSVAAGGKASLDRTDLDAILAHIRSTAGRDEPAGDERGEE